MAPNTIRLGELLSLFDMQRSSLQFGLVQADLPGSHILALNYDEVKRRRDLSLLMYLSCVRLRGTSCGLRL